MAVILPPPIQEITTDPATGRFPQVWIRWLSSVFTFIDTLQKSHFDNTIIVKSKADLLSIDSTKNYMIDGDINMGSQSIEIPEGGLSISAINGARDTSSLFSAADNHTMFTSPIGGYSGDVVIDGLTILTTGANSKVFDLDNDGNFSAIDITSANFTDCTSLGELTDYRQLLLNNVGLINIDDGLTFSGTWAGGIAILTSIVVNFPAATLLKRGTALSIQGSVRSDINFNSVNAASVLCDFQPSDINIDGGFSLTDVRTTATNALPNFPSSDVKARIRNCLGLDNTYVGGEYKIATTATTVIASANTLVKMAGTTTYDDLQWFSQTTNNAFVYDSTQNVNVRIESSLSFSGSRNRVVGIQIRKWDNSASAYVDIGARFTATLNGGGTGTRAENVVCIGNAELDENDRIEIWIENQTDTNNITAIAGGFVGLTERSS